MDCFSLVNPKFYLPSEVKPEHLVDLKGFEVEYDALKGQSFLTREETLKPSEIKQYSISIIDIWKINEGEIDNLKNRTREIFSLLENTEYVDSAKYLTKNIKIPLMFILKDYTCAKTSERV